MLLIYTKISGGCLTSRICLPVCCGYWFLELLSFFLFFSPYF